MGKEWTKNTNPKPQKKHIQARDNLPECFAQKCFDTAREARNRADRVTEIAILMSSVESKNRAAIKAKIDAVIFRYSIEFRIRFRIFTTHHHRSNLKIKKLLLLP